MMNSQIYATPHFKWAELSCKCGCGTRNISPRALAKLQALRELAGPLVILSAARCPIYNARVGGAPLSQHRSTPTVGSCAFDIALGNYDKTHLIKLAVQVGFGGIGGNYATFLHVDDRGVRARW